MIRAFLRHALFDDILLKLVSLVLACVLFVLVRGDRDAVTGVYAKVVYLLPQDRVLVSDRVDEVRIGIRGPWTRISHLDEKDIGAIRVDLSRYTDGDLSFTEDMIKLPVGLRVASISPPVAHLKFEPRIERVVPVQPILEGEPATGFRVAATSAHPREVRVSGAKSVVEGIQRARTRPLRISDAHEPVRGEVALENAPPRASWEGGTVITVDADVVQALAEKVLRAQLVQVTGMGRLDATVSPATVDVVLRGPSAAVGAVPAGSPSLLVDGAAEDAKAPGSWRKRISVVGLPPGVAAEVRPETVTLVTAKRRRE